ncbi:class I-like SAM-binding methyltransferase superfamily [Balamuthia mandrillaris]
MKEAEGVKEANSNGATCVPAEESPGGSGAAAHKDWSVHKTAEGHTYYYHHPTKRSTWSMPHELRAGYGEQEELEAEDLQRYAEEQGFDPWEDEQYFGSYADLQLQEGMTKDKPRSEGYLQAMLQHPSDFVNKVVLDVGCGTGLLSFFAARAGAKKVYAVEGSPLAHFTKQTVTENGLDEVISVIHGKIEDVVLPEKVDVLVSEWMGSLLVFESMIESVLYARDKWLKPDGVMYPSKAIMWISPIEQKELWHSKVNYWKDVYGVNMSAMIEYAKQCNFAKPLFDRTVAPEDLLLTSIDDAIQLASFDMATLSVQDLEVFLCLIRFLLYFLMAFLMQEISTNFTIRVPSKRCLHGFVAWFDVVFDSGNTEEHSILLSTSPYHAPTHWRQELFIMDEEIQLNESEATLSGTFTITRNAYWRRHFNIDISFSLSTVEDGTEERSYKSFPRWRQKTDVHSS